MGNERTREKDRGTERRKREGNGSSVVNRRHLALI